MGISKQFEATIIAATLCSISAVAGAQGSVAYKPQKVASSPAAGSLFLYPERIALKDGGFVTAERGILFVPANREKANSDVIGIEIYRFRRSSSAPANAPPIFRLNGGPDYPGLEPSVSRPGYFEKEIRPYLDASDFVVIGQRGIGSSKPNTVCERPTPVAVDAPVSAIAEAERDAARRCQKYWSGAGLDYRGITVPAAAADVNDVRKALGYSKFQIWGGSFGSHWGMAVMRYYPQFVERAVLRGLEGPDNTYDSPQGIWNAIGRIAATADTAAALKGMIPQGGLLNAFRTVIDRVEKNPVNVSLTDSAGHTQTVRVDADAVRDVAVAAPAQWPARVIEMYNGDLSVAARQAYAARRQNGIEHASYYMFDCGSGITAARDKLFLADTAARYVGGRNDEYRAVCPLWPSDNGDAFRTMFRTPIPTVLVQGDWDTSTPMENSLELKPFFLNSKYVLVKGGSHGSLLQAVAASDSFARGLIRYFATGDMGGIPEVVELPPVKWIVPKPRATPAK
jgi:pimeloyl-ACP methyl ester carboxylesterase